MAKKPSNPKSRLTAQGQISVPARVREGLGLSPGAVLEWSVLGNQATVRRLGRHTFEDVHAVLFPDGVPSPKTLGELKDGIGAFARGKHARRRH